MEKQGAAAVAHDHEWQAAGTAATRWALTALVTGICGGVANWIRNTLNQRRERAAMASSVQNIRQVIAPESPDKDDLGTRVDRIQSGLDKQAAILAEREHRMTVLEDGQQAITERLDGIQDQATRRHSELCALILKSRN